MTAQPIEDDDPFAEALLDRDQYGRPRIVQPDGSVIPYTRASTFADALDNGSGLSIWKVRTAALGVARYPDISAQVASLRYAEPGDRPAKGSHEQLLVAWKQRCRDIKADKATLDELVDLAQHRVDDRASHGTAVHGFTDPDPSPFVPERMSADVNSYHAKMAELGIVQELSEQFVVNDELQVAGTFDGTYRVPFALLLAAHEAGYLPGFDVTDTNDLVGGDKKTGSIHGQAVGIQTAVYFRGGKLYTPNLDGTATRTEHGARTDVAILIHIPKGKGVTEVYPISLVTGWADALLAVQVREADAHNKIAPAFPIAAPEPTALVAEAAAEAKPKRKRRTKAEMAAARAAEAEAAQVADDAASTDDWVAVATVAEPVVSVPDPVPTVAELVVTVAEPVATTPVTQAADRIIGDIEAARATGFVSSPERDAALANAAANLAAKQAAPEPSNADLIAVASSVEKLLELHAAMGATWTDDDKALATARRNLLLGGVATTAVTA